MIPPLKSINQIAGLVVLLFGLLLNSQAQHLSHFALNSGSSQTSPAYSSGFSQVWSPDNESHLISSGFIQPRTKHIVHETTPHLEAEIYPVPASDRVYFSIRNAELTNYSVTIFNSESKQILSKDYNKNTGVINLSGIPPGIYYLNILNKNSKKNRTFKIVTIH
ncbi:MAG: T9SS type A sorting domain-containing protein [Bacteroidota bacterium]|nr:T9SS type A sorting domain-containing protein [Bacteroidota bacterium]